MEILGYEIEDKTIFLSNGERIEKLYLKELLIQMPGVIRVTSSVVTFAQRLLKIIGINTKDEHALYQTTRFKTDNTVFRLIPKKFFSIKRNNKFAYFADIGQYTKIPEFIGREELAIFSVEIGTKVCSVLKGLGVGVTSLVNPPKSYEEYIVSNLKNKLEESDGIEKKVIENILVDISEKLATPF